VVRPWVVALPRLVLALGLALTALATVQSYQRKAEEHARGRQELLEDVRSAIHGQLDVNTALLSSVVGLFHSSEEVTLGEFRSFYRSLASQEDNTAGIQGVGFARFIPAAQLESTLAGIRTQGQPGFKVFPPGERPNYSAIQFLEPLDWRNRLAIGYDMYSQSTRHAAMERAALTGKPSMSGKVRLLQEGSKVKQAGVLLYLPIYRPGSRERVGSIKPASLEALQGWAYSPLRMGDLMVAVLGGVRNPLLGRATVVLYDGPKADPAQELFRNTPASPGGSRGNSPEKAYASLDAAGRPWLLGVGLRQGGFPLPGLTGSVWLTFALGGISSALVAGITELLVREQELIRRDLEISQQLNREQALATTVFEQTPYGISVTDPQGMILDCNEAFCRITGYTKGELLGQNQRVLKSGRQDPDFYRHMWEQIVQTGRWEGEIWNRLRSGEIQRHELTIQAVRNEGGETILYVGMLHDVSRRHLQEEQIRFQARHDYLTGLANRAELVTQMDQALALARRYGQQVGLLFLDLDGFKAINDRLGHATGDLVLQRVAARLEQVIRESDTLCRQGGDEFVLLVPQANHEATMVRLARKLQEEVERPMPELSGLPLSVSIGIALYPDHVSTAEQLLHQADAAMYRAKQSKSKGHGGVAMALPVSPAADTLTSTEEAG
jgi:diguanylate cyclase (GGDEF)-like protein/PAS domain S-box-containing protein